MWSLMIPQEAGRGRSDCGRTRLGGFGRARAVGRLCAGREGRVRLEGSRGRRRLLLGRWRRLFGGLVGCATSLLVCSSFLVRFVGWVLRCGFGGSSRSAWYCMVQVRLCGPRLHVQGFMFYLLVREVLRSRCVVCVSTCMCLQGVVVNNVAAIDVTFSMASTLSDPSGAGAGARSLPKGRQQLPTSVPRFVDYNSTIFKS